MNICSLRELLHPELQYKSCSYLVLRSSMFSKWWYPADEQIGWYGDVKMYCTAPQYAALYKPEDKSGIGAGPF